MKQWMVCGALFLFAAKAAVSCGTNGDTVVNVQALGGYTVGGINYGNLTPATALNQLLTNAGCGDTTLTIELRSSVDTIKLNGPIRVTRTYGSNGRITIFWGEAGTAAPYHALVVEENSQTAPSAGAGQAYLFDATSPMQLQGSQGGGLTIIRSAFATAGVFPAVSFEGGKGSAVSGCQFWLEDSSSATPSSRAVIAIRTDSVLIERNLFRSPANGPGRCIAIFDSATGPHVEIRANAFNNTGVDVAGNDLFHLYANTFVGTRNAFSPVMIESNVPTTDSGNIQIQHNLFAIKNDTLPPINFRANLQITSLALTSVKYNAWTRSSNTLQLTMSGTGPSYNAIPPSPFNILMAKGFSNYGSSVSLKDYPLVQMQTDSTLSPTSAEFELTKIYKSYPSSFPQVDSDLTNGKLFFPNNFVAYSNTDWGANNIKVGAFGAVDQSNPRPSPINPRINNQGDSTSLHFAALTGDPTRINGTARIFDNNYYGGSFFAPTLRLFFFSTARGTLVGSDSTALKTATNGVYVSNSSICCTSPDTLVVPNQARIAAAPGQTETLYLKMLHYNPTGQAVIEDSNAVIDTITTVPAYPFNDLTLAYSDISGIATGQVTLSVTLGKEVVDSIRVYELSATNVAVDSMTHVPSITKSYNFTNVPSGLYHFAAVPFGLGRMGVKTAAATTTAQNFRQISGDTVWVSIPSGACPSGTNGSAKNPFCALSDGLNYLQGLSGGGTIIVDSTSQPILDDTIAGDSTSSITIMSMLNASGQFPLSRPVFADVNGAFSALTISRPNVTVKGFVFQMPTGADLPAVAVQAGATGIVLESNLFRSASRSGFAGTGLSLSAATGHVSNNVFWGFTHAIDIANGSPTMWITENTFLNDSAFSGFAQANAITASAASVSTRIYHNFYADYTVPYNASIQGGTDTLVGNVYTSTPDQNLLQGHVEAPVMGVAPTISEKDLSAAGYGAQLVTVFSSLETCNQLVECSPLYAGAYEASPPSGYPILSDDFLGNPRVNRPEIGAYEFQNAAGSALGRLQFAAGFDTVFSQAKISIASMNIDSVDADSIWVWWSTNKSDAYATVPATNRLSYRVASLITGGPINGSAKNLVANTSYWFHSQLIKVKPNALSDGYIYSQSYQTSSLLTSTPCNLDSAHGVCPSQGSVTGYFIDTTSGPFQGLYRSQVDFNTLTPGNGSVQAPVFMTPDANRLKGILPAANTPMIRLNVQTDGNMGKVGSNDGYQVNIVGMSSLFPTLMGTGLYILPSGTTGLPTYVSDWSMDSNGTLQIQLHSTGTLDLVFGNFPAATAGGTVASSSSNVQAFNYDGAQTQTFQWPLQGAAFLTSNPLILATPVPSGGSYSKSVISGSYPVQSDLISSGVVVSLGDSLKYATALSYYRRLASADSGAAFFAHQQKPFYLNAVAAYSDLKAAVTLDSLSVDNSGAASPTVQLNFGNSWKTVSNQATRGAEVILTVFDGGKISYSHVFLQSDFSESDLGPNDQMVQFAPHVWNLYTYPWSEAPGGNIARLVGSDSYTYPNQKVLKYNGSGEGAAGYTIYNAANFSSLSIDSGRAFWGGNGQQPYKPITAGGNSIDNSDFTLPLTAGQYNDFGMPFNFPVKLQDVFDTSGLTASSMAIYRLDDINGKDVWTRMDATQSALGVLYPWMGYTVKPTAAVSLKFPLVDSSRSATPLSKKAATNSLAWKADLWASDAEAIATLRLSKGAIAQQFGEAPQVPGQTFRIGFAAANGSTQILSSEIEEPAATGLQGHWPLHIDPEQGFNGVDLQLHDSTGSVTLYLVETVGQTITPLGDSTLHLTADALDQGDYHVVAGTLEYAEAFLSSAIGSYDLRLVNFPNPFSSETSIRFSLPSTLLSVTYHLRIFDFQGRLVWEQTWNGGPMLNTIWDGRNRLGGRVPAGEYHLLLQAQVPGKPAFEARRALVKLD